MVCRHNKCEHNVDHFNKWFHFISSYHLPVESFSNPLYWRQYYARPTEKPQKAEKFYSYLRYSQPESHPLTSFHHSISQTFQQSSRNEDLCQY